MMANESVSRETAIDAIVLAIVANDRWFDATDDELRQEAERLLAGAEVEREKLGEDYQPVRARGK